MATDANAVEIFKNCHCGKSLDEIVCNDITISCCNCMEIIGVGNITYYCAAPKCKFSHINGFPYNICAECIKILPLYNKTQRVEFLLFSLETATNKYNVKKENENRLKLYAYQLRHTLYNIINNYYQRSKLSEAIYNELMNEFNNLYQQILSQICNLIEKNELQLNDNILETKDDNNNINEEKTKSINELTLDVKTEIRVKWDTININNNEDVDMTCNNISECKCIARISYLLQLYTQYMQDITVNIFNSCLESYKFPNMINDFVHIINKHHNVNDLKDLNNGVLIKLCDDKNCESETKRFSLVNNYKRKTESNKETNIGTYFQMLHSYFAHQNGTIRGMNVNNPRNITSEIYDNDQNRFNKFQTIINEQIDTETSDEKYENNEIEEEKTNYNKIQITKTGRFSFGTKFYYWSYFENEKDEYITNAKYDCLKEELLSNDIYTMKNETFNELLTKSYDILQCSRAKRLKSEERGLNNQIYEIPVNLPLSCAHLLVLLTYTNITNLQYEFKKHGTRKIKQTDTIYDIKKRHIKIANWFRLLYEIVLFYGNDTTPFDMFYHGISVKLLFGEFSPNFQSPISTTTLMTVAQGFAETGIVISLQSNTSREDRYFDVRWASAFPEENENLFVQASNLDIIDIRIAMSIKISHINYMRAIKLFDQIFKYQFNKQCNIDILINELFVGNKNMSSIDIQSFYNFICDNEYDTDAIMADLKTSLDLNSNIQNYLINNKIFQKNNIRKHTQKITFLTHEIPPYIFELFCNLIKIKTNEIKNSFYIIKSEFDKLDKKLKSRLITFNNNVLSCPLFGNNVDNKLKIFLESIHMGTYYDNFVKRGCDQLNDLQTADINMDDLLNVFLITDVNDRKTILKEINKYFTSYKHSPINNQNIYFVQEFIWIIKDDEMNKLKQFKSGISMNGNKQTYSLSEHDKIVFVPDFTRSETKWPHLTGFGIFIESIPSDMLNVQFNTFLSFQFDEVKYFVNDKTKLMKNNMYMGYKTFKNELLNQLSTLTIRMAIKFEAIS